MIGEVSMIGGHIDYHYECEICGKTDGYERADGRNICDRCYANLEKKDAFLTYVCEVAFDQDFNEKANDLMNKFTITPTHAGCYLCNFGDNDICLGIKGGCKNLDICRQIRESEEQDNETLD